MAETINRFCHGFCLMSLNFISADAFLGANLEKSGGALVAIPVIYSLQAKQVLLKRLGDDVYQNPIPSEVNPSHVQKFSSDING
ncbi:hypothetical protein [Lysinibacillus fusiformis]